MFLVNLMASIGQISTHACVPFTPPALLLNGVLVHRSHFWATFFCEFHMAREGVNEQALTQASQPMHLDASIVRTLPLAVSTWFAPVGHASTQGGNGHWWHWA